MPSIVVPAHNEQDGLARLLPALLDEAVPDELEVIVVCNGCTDDSAAVARAFGPRVRVELVDEASKVAALIRGDEVARFFPRLYVDADVEIGVDGVRQVCAALSRPGILAASARRDLQMDRVVWPVRSYYRVWQQLPQVRAGLFGRGVVAVSQAGHLRMGSLPAMISDDLIMSEAFAPHERLVVQTATVVIHPPRTVKDLLRRRTRVAQGNNEVERAGLRAAASRTSIRSLLALVKAQPRLGPHMPVFLAVTVLARAAAARARINQTTWLRDDSSRRA